MALDISQDARRVLDTLQAGGIAIIPSSVGYGIIGSTPAALQRIFTAKRRTPDKKHAMIGNYELHKSIHILPPGRQALVQVLAVTQDLPLGVVAPYDFTHALLRTLDPQTISQSTDTEANTLAMLVNGGPFQEELTRLASAAGTPVFGSSANLSGRGTKTRVEEIERDVLRVADVVLDYGLRVHHAPRASSTMIDFGFVDRVKVVRFGACYEVIRDVLGKFGGEACARLPVDPGKQVLFSGRV
ncbi:hypothetical protein P175DRAFT_0431016 [Aspergillus ochraceoroseus IBT 24754]|uniref:Threonylcarbamoyl-AMP synthase n=2 Tax=Aspergillus ochraceoroseus TaxID=138278 RepID=A0A2T5M3Z0_9EURO|nr:uncharacterized protein P175DRAFT_0431016 [Aspergillus ochraceoroseus IBT 24754]KKK24951.1 hypothetical protein AOCH_002646 [Aspergillus ochraceoroseus]PTU23249.1 hypothetical protein P175DRAFT_0431016 [Aspergillus ochraceoroseus IBT 24754]